VSPDATNGANSLLMKLGAASGVDVLSGQANDPGAPAAATAAVMQATGKLPAIYSADLGSAEERKAVLQEAIRAHEGQAIVSLSWHPSRPTDNAPASAHDQLSDFEWNELLTPGSDLNRRWIVQVNDAADSLRELAKADVPVLWNPYPESNGSEFWWAGRKGIHGSVELYRQLFDRLVNHDGLHNLIWVWEASAPDFRPGGAGQLGDFFPGLLYTDALEINVHDSPAPFRAGGFLKQFSVGKPIGVAFSGNMPIPETFTQNASWSWFLAAPGVSQMTDPNTRADALLKVYADQHIATLPAPR
jgi:mannan endo-1,4-beta-mannosidase